RAAPARVRRALHRPHHEVRPRDHLPRLARDDQAPNDAPRSDRTAVPAVRRARGRRARAGSRGAHVSKKKKKAAPAPPPQETSSAAEVDPEETVNLVGDVFSLPGRDDLEEPTHRGLPDSVNVALPSATRKHLKGLVEALIFASDHPITPKDIARTASAQTK